MQCYRQYGLRTLKESGIPFELPPSLVSKEETLCAYGRDSGEIAGDIGAGSIGEAGEGLGSRNPARPPASVCVVFPADDSPQVGEGIEGQEFQPIEKRVSVPAEAAVAMDEQLLCIYCGQCIQRDDKEIHRGSKHEMRKTYKYRLLGNKATFSKAEMWLELCRSLYNSALSERIYAYKGQRVSLSSYSQIKELPELKVDFPEYGDVGSQVLQDVVERLDRAYRAFFRRARNGAKAGFPRFKSRDRYDSFTLKQAGWKLDGKYLSIRNVGRFKLRLSRPIQGNIKTITIRRDAVGKWYACFSCDKVPERKLPESGEVIGLDVGVKSFLVDSEGNKVDNPQYFRQGQRLLRVRQRMLSRRAKGSERRHKARILVAKAHDKVYNQRRDFLHKVANSYIGNYGTLVFEDLNISGMVRNHSLAKSISDSGWGTFYGLCAYKAEEAGRQVIRIPRFEPSSKTCSACGAINQELKLSDRQWVCKSCGALHDRDYNAAKNIRRVGQTLQEATYASRQSVS